MAKADPKLDTSHADAWAPPEVNAQGFEVDSHGLPTSRPARAMQLAQDGKSSDPADPPLVTPDEIAAQNPAGVAKDQEAAADMRLKRDWGEDATADDFGASGIAFAEPPVPPPPADTSDKGA